MSNHQKFLEHLDASDGAVWIVAKLLHKRGYTVEVPAVSRAEKHEDWKDHADSGDLYITNSRLGIVRQRVEVKRLSVNFSSKTDWPFATKFIVCAKHAYDRAIPKPYAYIILASEKKHAACVFSSESTDWYVESRTDARYDPPVTQEFYFAPIDTVTFFSTGLETRT